MNFRDKDYLLTLLRDGEQMMRSDKIRLVALLSFPAMLGQLSSIIMQYIDAMMVGQIGASASASIGLVSTTTWLFGGITVSLCSGFAVLVAQHIGAKENDKARDILRQAITVCLCFATTVSLICVAIHHHLPIWLGGSADVCDYASKYFLIWALMVPVMQILHLCNGMLRCSGNMKMPMILGIAMCVLDICFNLLFIPRWGVVGAALATAVAGSCCAIWGLWYLCTRSKELSLIGHPGSFMPKWEITRKGFKIGIPMVIEHAVFCGAQIVSTIIVAPLGTVAIAANTIGITVESLCYMPGYGIGEAATTLVGQSIGAKRHDLVRSFSYLTVFIGMAVMTTLGIVMYAFAPELMQMMSSSIDVQIAGTEALRIEAFAEPLYAASIVAYGVFVGAGYTLVPCIMNLGSIWLVRIPLAAWLATSMGLRGVWLAMCLELCFRGIIFLIQMQRKLGSEQIN